MPDPVNTVPPVVSGTPTSGNVLSCSQGSWTNSPNLFAYQWKRETGVGTGIYSDITGAIGSTYRLTDAEIARRMECVVTATVGAVASPVASSGFPLSAHRYGQPGAAMSFVDFVIAYSPDQGNPNTARAGGNPNLVAFTQVQLHPGTGHSMSFTYGVDLNNFTGVNDALAPNAQGTIRGFRSSDNGCITFLGGSDQIPAFRVDVPETADFIKRAAYYAWKLNGAAAKGYDGIWSDNVVPGNIINASWFFGPNCSIIPSQWDTGLKSILNGLRGLTGKQVGGNVSFRADNASMRAATTVSMLEDLEGQITSADQFGTRVSAVQAWQNTADPDGLSRLLMVMHRIPSSNTSGMRFGLACTCILGGAYRPYQDDNALYFPAEMTSAGNRHYLGNPTSAAYRSSNTWARNFQFGTVRANFDNHTATFS